MSMSFAPHTIDFQTNPFHSLRFMMRTLSLYKKSRK